MSNVLLSRLTKVTKVGDNKWKACCPSHEDSTPSLMVKVISDGRILIHCFAGCNPVDVMQSVGLSLCDLYPDGAIADDLKSWEMMKRKVNKDGFTEMDVERRILKLGHEWRKQGKKLSKEDLARERLAFDRVRNANN